MTSPNPGIPKPGTIVDASFLGKTSTSPPPFGSSTLNINQPLTSPDSNLQTNIFPSRPKKNKTYAHLKGANFSELTTSDPSFLGLPTQPEQDAEYEIVTLPVSEFPPPIPQTGSGSGSKILSSFSSAVARLRPSGAAAKNSGRNNSISTPPAIEEPVESEAFTSNLPPDCMCVYVRLGRLSQFHDSRYESHDGETSIIVRKQDQIQAIVEKFVGKFPELASESFKVFHNSRQIQNLGLTIEESEIQNNDQVDVSSFNPNADEFYGVIQASIGSLIFGAGFSLFCLGFSIENLISRSIVVLIGFLVWFFGCIGCCTGFSKTNLLSHTYNPGSTQTWKINRNQNS